MNAFRSIVVIFLAVAGITAACANSRPAPEVIKLEPLRERLRTLRVTVNGQEGEFLLDTGGGATIISPAFAQKIGCKPWGRLTGFRMMGERLDLQRCDDVRIVAGGVALRAVTVGVLDAPDLKPGTKAPDGSLALDVFKDRLITLEIDANRVTLETPESFAARTAGAREIPIRISRELAGAATDIYVAVPTPRGQLWFLIDSGNGGTLLVAKDMAQFFSLDPQQQGPQPVRIEVAPGIVAQWQVGFTPEMIMDGNLGMPFINRHVISVDLRNERMWIKPLSGPR
jgi:hypothetical protein